MKTAVGYLFLSLAASMVGVVVILLFFAVIGKLHLFDAQLHIRRHVIGLCIYGFIHLSSLFPLTYYGLKWSRKGARRYEQKQYGV